LLEGDLMRITVALILALILALIVTIFAVQNNTAIDVAFLAWTIDGSLALILMITFALGILIGLLVSTPAWIRRVRQSADLRKNLRVLEKDLEQARKATVVPSEYKPTEEPVADKAAVEEPEKKIDEDTSEEIEEE
jgi:putative membrane protein